MLNPYIRSYMRYTYVHTCVIHTFIHASYIRSYMRHTYVHTCVDKSRARHTHIKIARLTCGTNKRSDFMTVFISAVFLCRICL